MLAGSLGLLPSASISGAGPGIYEPVGGAAGAGGAGGCGRSMRGWPARPARPATEAGGAGAGAGGSWDQGRHDGLGLATTGVHTAWGAASVCARLHTS